MMLMGCLMASSYISAPPGDKYGQIQTYERMLEIVQNGTTYKNLGQLRTDLGIKVAA